MKKIFLVAALVLFAAVSCNKDASIVKPDDSANTGTVTPAPAPTPTEAPTPPPVGVPNPAVNPPPPPPAIGPTTHNVTIKSFAYASPTLNIKKGDTVVWTNKDSVAHTVTTDGTGPNSASLPLNKTYSYTFNTVGTFNYYCIPHPNMKAKVIVKE